MTVPFYFSSASTKARVVHPTLGTHTITSFPTDNVTHTQACIIYTHKHPSLQECFVQNYPPQTNNSSIQTLGIYILSYTSLP